MARLHFGWSLLDFGPYLPRGVMVAQETLDLFVLVRVQARQPARKRPVAPRDYSRAECFEHCSDFGSEPNLKSNFEIRISNFGFRISDLKRDLRAFARAFDLEMVFALGRQFPRRLHHLVDHPVVVRRVVVKKN